MPALPWLKWSEMNWLRLMEGPGDRVILPIAPAGIKKITYKGERIIVKMKVKDCLDQQRRKPAKEASA